MDAADGVGWNSTTCKPWELRYLRAYCRDKILQELTKKDKTIADLNEQEKYLKEIHQKSVRRLKKENVLLSQKTQQLTVLLSDKERTIAHWKIKGLNANARSRQIELCLDAKEKTIFDLEVSNKRLQSELNTVNVHKVVNSTMNFKNLFVCFGICFFAYKLYHKRTNWIDFITLYSLSSVRKMYSFQSFVNFLVNIPLNIVTKEL